MITQSISTKRIYELSTIKSLRIDDFYENEIKGSKQEFFIEDGFVSIDDIERYTATILEKQKQSFVIKVDNERKGASYGHYNIETDNQVFERLKAELRDYRTLYILMQRLDYNVVKEMYEEL